MSCHIGSNKLSKLIFLHDSYFARWSHSWSLDCLWCHGLFCFSFPLHGAERQKPGINEQQWQIDWQFCNHDFIWALKFTFTIVNYCNTLLANFHWRVKMKLMNVLMLIFSNLSSTYSQGYFPKLEDLAVLKPITSSSTCGATSSKYCQSLAKQTSLTNCVEKNCEFACCTNCGSAKPVPTDFALASNKVGVTQDGDPRNGTIVRSFRFQGNSYLQPLRVPFIDFQNPGFTISVWIKQKAGNKG